MKSQEFIDLLRALFYSGAHESPIRELRVEAPDRITIRLVEPIHPPKPREIWVNRYAVDLSMDTARAHFDNPNAPFDFVKFREVIE